MSSSKPLIQLSAMSKVFLTDEVETHALGGVEMEIRQGEYVSITGPSGCGKSTLLSILGMLDTPSNGTYHFDGVAVHGMKPAQRAAIRNREIGFIFQAFNLIGDLSVSANVELPLIFRGDLSKAERAERVQQALEQVGMAHRAQHFPAQLSGGQQQRVAVARALAGRPSILLADEPTGNLDSRNSEAVMTLLSDLHSAGSTICMVTHDVRYADVAQRQIFMFDGKVVDAATSQRLRSEEAAQFEVQLARSRRQQPAPQEALLSAS
jgi:putative ABC transport system ATP-binding protein